MNRTLHRPCHNSWACAVARSKSQVVLGVGQVSNNQIPAKGSRNPAQSSFWALEQHCCVSCWGINSHHLPAATEALAELLHLKANVEDYTVTFYICTSVSSSLWQERILPLCLLMPFKHKSTILDGLCWWMDYFSGKAFVLEMCSSVNKLCASDYKNYLKHNILKTLFAET